MAKGKKKGGKPANDEHEEENDQITETVIEEEEAPVKSKMSKKDRKKKKEAELEEAQAELEALNNDPDADIAIEKPAKGKKTKKAEKKAVVDDNSEEEEDDKPVVKKSGFALLMDSDGSPEEEEEEKVKPKKKEKSKKKTAFEMMAEIASDSDGKEDEDEEQQLKEEQAKEEAKANKKKDKKKKKKADKAADEDDVDELEAALADLGLKKDDEDKEEDEKARKKREKRERQKQKQLEGGDTEAAAEAPADGKKGKKKKKGKEEPVEIESKETEEVDGAAKKKGKKGMSGKMLQELQDALKKQQEDEERLKELELERIKKEEEAEKERLEKKRVEDEKRAAKKQRDQERKAQLRKEGKLLTAKQKADKAKAEAMLEAMRAQGMDVPAAGEKRGAPRLGTRVRGKNQKAKSQTPETDKEVTPVPELTENGTKEKIEEVTAKDTKPAEDDVADAWDASSSDSEDEPEEVKEKKDVAAKKEEPAQKPQEQEDEEEDEDSEDSEDDDSDESDEDELSRREIAMARIAKRRTENEKNRSVDELRAPVVCVLGHVDTGKTKILDKLRRTHVQDGEAGGITQQIGATNVPCEVIKEQCKMVKNFEIKVPGLLIIDTPGHESFSNLRDRGSSLCDIAILVVDIMHGLEPQTIESINLLKKKKTPFVIALNKVDRIYMWKSNRHKDIEDVVNSQEQNTQLEFKKRAQEVIVGMAEQGLNAALCYENTDPSEYISMVPTSAHSGEGMGNLMGLLVSLSQTMLAKRIAYSDELQATVLEVKAISGLGTTIDIVLVNGRLKEGQTMILAGTEGPIVTPIKALLTPSKMQDLRVKVTYIEHKEIRAAQGVKIAAKELEKSIAGLNLLVANQPDEVEVCKDEMAARLRSALNSIKLKDRGVFVQASTLGSLEALLEFLRTSKIPYAGVKIGPVVKKDVMKASVMLEHEAKYTIILAFDVKVERDAQEMADSMGVKIFQADIIYHLFDRFTAYQEELKQKKKDEFKHVAVFPCKIKFLPNCIFNSRDPIVAGVSVEAGIIRMGTPLCVPSKEFLEIGIVTSIQSNHKDVESARKGEEVCIKVEPIPGESPKMFGRHFDETDMVMSKISRTSIDACKDYFVDDLQKNDWRLMVELKKVFQIL